MMQPPRAKHCLLDTLATHDLPLRASACGAAMVLSGGVRQIGDTPYIEVIRSMSRWLQRSERDVFATDCGARDGSDVALGELTPPGMLAADAGFRAFSRAAP